MNVEVKSKPIMAGKPQDTHNCPIALAVGGMLLGIIVAMLVVPAMNGLLFGVTWADPASFVGAIGLLVLVAAVAGLIPAQRAARVDPSVVLRDG